MNPIQLPSGPSQPEFWQWVDTHLRDNVDRLRLDTRNNPLAVTQVECRQRYSRKLADTLTRFPHLFFPTVLSGEQCTGDALATLHSRFVCADDTLVDLTAGLGIDVMHLARKVSMAVAVERDSALTDALRYNAQGLGVENLTIITGDCRDLLSQGKLKGTVAFIDPARRAGDGSRLFGLADCQPDVLSMLPHLRSSFGRLIIKASPMLDVARTIADLPGVTDIWLTGTTTECKELDAVVDLQGDSETAPRIHAVTVLSDGMTCEYSFTRGDEADATAILSTTKPRPGDMLYEPYPSTMKAGPVKLLSQQFGLAKFHANTHLYYGSDEVPATGFPGTAMRIVDVIPWQSKNLKRFKANYPRISVTVRNFGMTADALRSKLGVRDGGTYRLFGIGLGSGHTDRLLVVTEGQTQC